MSDDDNVTPIDQAMRDHPAGRVKFDVSLGLAQQLIDTFGKVVISDEMTIAEVCDLPATQLYLGLKHAIETGGAE